jgi:hypothetical protein
MVQEAIDKKCSLSNTKWALYHVFFHPENKTSLTELRMMSVEQFLDHQEALTAMQMIKMAIHKDAEFRSSIENAQPNRRR